MTGQIDEIRRVLLQTHDPVDVGDQERQGLMDARQILAGETALHIGIRAHTQKYGVVFVQQALEREVPADLGFEHELHPHTLQHLTTAANHLFFQLERGNAEGQQTADLRITVIDHRLNAVAGEHIGTAQAGGTGADNGHPLAGIPHIGEIRTPTPGQGGIGDVLLHIADGHGAEAVVESAGPFTQAILRTHPAANLRQGIGPMTKLGGLEEIALGDQLQPVGDVIVDRALPFAVRIATGQAALGLIPRAPGVERPVDLVPIVDADFHRSLGRIVTGQIQKLKCVCHDVFLVG